MTHNLSRRRSGAGVKQKGRHMRAEPTLAEIRDLHLTAAILAAENAVYLPIFERMEIELAEAEARAASDPITQARRRLEARRMTA